MIFEKIRNIIVDELNVDAEKVTLDTHLVDDLGADSLDAINLVMTIESEFGVELSDTDIENIKYVKDLVKCIEKIQ